MQFIPYERIENKIYTFRGKKVMIDRDLASLYEVTTKVLNQAVQRNPGRFPEDFMFRLSWKEAERLRSQFVTLNEGAGSQRGQHLKYRPCVFTEQGIAMLSSVLRSERAILVNIQIIRTFTKMREMIVENDHLRKKIELMEKQYDEQFRVVFDALRRLLDEEAAGPAQIGFRDGTRE